MMGRQYQSAQNENDYHSYIVLTDTCIGHSGIASFLRLAAMFFSSDDLSIAGKEHPFTGSSCSFKCWVLGLYL